MGLNHMPSGRFGANGAWLAFNVMAHNLTRWVEALGLHEAPPMTTKTMRRRLLRVPGRLTRSGRRSRHPDPLALGRPSPGSASPGPGRPPDHLRPLKPPRQAGSP